MPLYKTFLVFFSKRSLLKLNLCICHCNFYTANIFVASKISIGLFLNMWKALRFHCKCGKHCDSTVFNADLRKGRLGLVLASPCFGERSPMTYPLVLCSESGLTVFLQGMGMTSIELIGVHSATLSLCH